MNEEWRNQLREKMADFQQPAPELSWEEINKALDERKQKDAHTQRLWGFRNIAAAAVLLFIVGAGYWVSKKENTQLDNKIVTKVVKNPLPASNASEENTSILQSFNSPAVSDISTVSTDTVFNGCVVQNTVNTTTDTASVKESQPTDTKPYISENEHQQASVTQKQNVIYPVDLNLRKHHSNRLTAKVYMSNVIAGSRSRQSITTNFINTIYSNHTEDYHYSVDALTDSTTYWTGFTDNPDVTPIIIIFKDTIITKKLLKSDCQIHHHQPIRFGLSLRYHLDDHWGIESGLSYTRLISDITMNVDNIVITTEQRLNYIGLPLNVNYQLWKGRNYGIYMAAGGTIEKMIDASPWQFSLNSAIGAEYKLSNMFSIYAEPGFGYYFSDGSSIPTIYKDHPFNFNLSFGLRFNP